MKQLVLASQSPRRQELLRYFDYPFLVCPAVGEEVMDTSLPPYELVKSLAEQKATEVLSVHETACIIGADTIVSYQGVIFGKPKTQEEAFSMLRTLSGNTHEVYTGVALVEKAKATVFYETTKVTMRSLSDEEIHGYLAQGESMDKAGSYGIQQKGAFLVESIEGDYYNVMGLPLCSLGKHLTEFGFYLFGNEGNR